jgi:beta-glucanase (GH16 family)
MKTLPSLLFSLFVAACISGCNNPNPDSSKEDTRKSGNGYELVWHDEFDYEGLPDSTKWSYDTEGNEEDWGNSELQFYTEASEENARVVNGSLFITARKQAFQGKEYTSARLISNAHWKYRRIEVRAKLPDAKGTWTAIWMMPGNWSFDDANWPDVGEIDIMEHVGYDPGMVHASAHSKDYHYEWENETQKTAIIKVPDATETFHSYIMEWTPDVMTTYVDDSLYFEYVNEGLGESKWPYDKPFYLILNVAVGGSWGSVMGIDEGAFPQTMEVDYVRVYKKTP